MFPGAYCHRRPGYLQDDAQVEVDTEPYAGFTTPRTKANRRPNARRVGVPNASADIHQPSPVGVIRASAETTAHEHATHLAMCTKRRNVKEALMPRPRKHWSQRTGRRRYPGEPGYRGAQSLQTQLLEAHQIQRLDAKRYADRRDELIARMHETSNRYTNHAADAVARFDDDPSVRAKAERAVAAYRRERARLMGWTRTDDEGDEQ